MWWCQEFGISTFLIGLQLLTYQTSSNYSPRLVSTVSLNIICAVILRLLVLLGCKIICLGIASGTPNRKKLLVEKVRPTYKVNVFMRPFFAVFSTIITTTVSRSTRMVSTFPNSFLYCCSTDCPSRPGLDLRKNVFGPNLRSLGNSLATGSSGRIWLSKQAWSSQCEV